MPDDLKKIWPWFGIGWLVMGAIGFVQMLEAGDQAALKSGIFGYLGITLLGAAIIWRMIRQR